MGWFVRERRGISWKEQTLDSISAPPLPLMVFFGLLITLLYFEICSEYQERVERRKSGFRFGLLLFPLAVVLALNMVALRHRMVRHSFGVPPPAYVASAEGGSSAAGLLLVLLMLLVMVHFQPTVQSGWFRLF
ncbi:hypothetical protein PHJA_001087000 [Phtheirospermum japonicum]|uniref:Uncharacterized protein n=1 Tax=Phtheirospermum japonicum TaxID=374723 RepID=A0A830BYT2_9LAMI|nr:hypothetical protein PHJA_001087000 [Phtheirospermum japonicum]